MVVSYYKLNMLYAKGLDANMKNEAQNNSVFARLWRSKYQKLYGTVCFFLMYLLLLYVGSRLFLVVGVFCERGKKWLSLLVVGLIILASSLLTKMFQNWRLDVRKRKKIEKE